MTEDDREQIFHRFRSLETKTEQDCYLQSLIGVNAVKRRRRRVTSEKSSKPAKGCTYIYEVSTSLSKIVVCKTAFINVHGITPDRVRRLCLLLAEGKSPIDKRGKSTPGNAPIPGHIMDGIQEHISSFPVKISHYTAKEIHYLSNKLDVRIMHNLFRQKHPELDVKYSYYRKVFKENFTLSFGRPQVDTCYTCGDLSVKIKSAFLNETAKRVATAENLYICTEPKNLQFK